MTPERWEQVKSVFEAALERAPAERPAFVLAACSGDEELRAEIERLVAEDEQAGSFLEAPAFAALRTFSQGQVVDGRFRILRAIGHGGMGEVYEADDLELKERVALKTVRPEIAADERVLARFHQEIQLARKVTHPNVCRIFDLHRVSEPGGAVTFLTMELLEGETLAARLHRQGRMAVSEALPLVVQMADALTAAHQAGVIHRDFKTGNVMLVPSSGGAARAVVTDFGLAFSIASDDTTAGAPTVGGGIVGTPAYMAPEQLEGGAVTAAADLYGLGVVMYEMVAGARPFVGESPLAIALQKLRRTPAAPSSHVPDLDPAWDAAILRCLARDPAERFTSAGQVVDAIRGTVPIPKQLVANLRRPRRLVFLALLIVVAIAAVAASWWLRRPYQPSPEAVRWYEKGVNALRDGTYYTASKMLQQALQVDSKFPMAHARLAEAWAELDYVDKAKQEMLLASPPDSTRQVLRDIDQRYLSAIHRTLTNDYKGAVERYQEIVRLAPDPEKAYAYLDLGRAYEKATDSKRALENYLLASQRDSQCASTFIRMAFVYGRQSKTAEAQKALERAETLYRASGTVEGIVEVLHRRGVLANSADRVDEARSYLEQALRAAQTSQDPHQLTRILLQLSSVDYKAGDTTTAQEHARKAVELGRANGVENLATRGLIDLGTTLFVRGDYRSAEGYFRDALPVARRYNSRGLEARAQFMLASLLITQGRDDEGRGVAEQALSYFRQTGDRNEQLSLELLIGRAMRNQGDYSGALRVAEQTRALSDEIGHRPELARAHELMASVLLRQERYPEALHHFQQTLTISRSLGNQLLSAYASLGAAQALLSLGRIKEARSMSQEAGEFATRHDGNRSLLASVNVYAAEMALSQRVYSEAMAKSRRALTIAGNEDPQAAAEAKAVLGLSESRSGKPQEGLRTCREAVEITGRVANAWLRSKVELALAEALLAAGDHTGAVAAALRLQEVFQASGQVDSHWRALAIAALASIMGEPLKGRQLASQAAEAFSSLQSKWGGQDFEQYSARPDVQGWRKELRRIEIARTSTRLRGELR